MRSFLIDDEENLGNVIEEQLICTTLLSSPDVMNLYVCCERILQTDWIEVECQQKTLVSWVLCLTDVTSNK